MSAIADSLIADIPRFSHDEQRALRVLFDRSLNIGHPQYGKWRAKGEQREMMREVRDELIDAVWYAACDVVLRADERAQRSECQRHDALATLAVAPAFRVVDGRVEAVHELPEPRSSYECEGGVVSEVLR